MLKSKKPLCEFGENCYRLNKEHLLEQSHPHLEAIMMSYKKHGVIRVPQHFQVPGIIEKQIRDLLNLKDSKYSTQGDVKYKGQKSKHSDETPSSSNSEDEMKIPKCTKSEMCKSLKVAHLQSNLHPHLEDILLKYRGFGSYNIPTHLQNDKIEEQLNIMIDNEIQHSLSEPNTGPGGKDQSASGPSGKGKKAKEKMSGSGTQNLKTGFAKKQSEVLSSSENEDDSDSSKPKASGPAKKGKPKVSKESFSSREGKRNEIDCKYASDCSMTNVEHFKRYEHEHLENLLWKFKVRGPSSIPKHMDKGLVAKQLELMSSFGQEDDLDSDSSKPKSSESAGKRKNKASKESSSSREDDHSGTTCRDGVKCKSENIRHLQKFEHPHLENLLWSYKNNGESCIPKNLKTNHFIKKQLEMMAYSDEEDDGYFNVKKTTTYNVGGNKTKQTTSTYSYGRSSKEDEEVPSTACQYGVKCSRKDETHFRNYAHPHLEMVLLKYKESGEMEIPAYVRENKAIADQLELLVNIHEIKVNKAVACLKGTVASKKLPLVAIYGLPQNTSAEDIIRAIYNQTSKDTGISLKELKTKARFAFKSGPRIGICTHIYRVPPSVRNSLITSTKLGLDWQLFRVRDWIDCPKCSHCQLYGHTASRCEAEKPSCHHCAELDHKKEACPNKDDSPVCATCTFFGEDATHITGSQNCPARKAAESYESLK